MADAKLLEAAWAVLDEIIDPCSVAARMPASLVDMGLVTGLHVATGPGGAHISVKLCTTHIFCMVAAIFLNEAHQRLLRLPGVVAVEVVLDSEIVWTPERMRADYRERLEKLDATGDVPANTPLTTLDTNGFSL